MGAMVADMAVAVTTAAGAAGAAMTGAVTTTAGAAGAAMTRAAMTEAAIGDAAGAVTMPGTTIMAGDAGGTMGAIPAPSATARLRAPKARRGESR